MCLTVAHITALKRAHALSLLTGEVPKVVSTVYLNADGEFVTSRVFGFSIKDLPLDEPIITKELISHPELENIILKQAPAPLIGQPRGVDRNNAKLISTFYCVSTYRPVFLELLKINEEKKEIVSPTTA